MGDNPNQPPAALEHGQSFHGRVQRLPVQGAKALVDEQRVQPHRSRVVLHHVRKPKGQGQGGQKLLPAGEGLNGAGQHRGPVQHLQIQAAVAPGGGAVLQPQGVPSPAEGGEKPVGAAQHLLQHHAEHVLQNGHFHGVAARQGLGQPRHPGELPLQGGELLL